MATTIAAAIATRFRHCEFQNAMRWRTCSGASASSSAGSDGTAGDENAGTAVTAGVFAAAAGFADGAKASISLPFVGAFEVIEGAGDAVVEAGCVAGAAVAAAFLLPSVWHSVRNALSTVCARASLTLM